MAKRRLLISIILVIYFSTNVSSQGLSCNGNAFLCTTSNAFLSCLDLGNGWVTVNDVAQTCPPGIFCSNTDQFECSSIVPPSTTKVTTKKPTTRKATTKKITTVKVTTKKPTTKKPTTKKPTTRKITTIKATTRKITTKKPTTKKPTTRKVTTIKATTRKITTKKPTTKKPTTRKITTIKATTRKITTKKPTTRKVTTIKATTRKITTKKPTTKKPTTRKVTTIKATTRKITTKKPTTKKPTTRKITTIKATTRKITTKKPTTRKVTTIKATTRKITTKNPTTKKPTTRKITTIKATTRKITTKKPTTRKITTKKATTRKITTKKPTTKKATTKIITTKKVTTRRMTTQIICQPTTIAPTPRPQPKCTAPGKMPNNAVANCKSYILCIGMPNVGYVSYIYTCPSTSVFDPVNKVCSLRYTCPVPTTPRPVVATPICTTIGRVPDKTVAGCRGYTLCSLNLLGGYRETKYLCPLRTLFDPIKKICSLTYVCPPEICKVVTPKLPTTRRITTKRPTTRKPTTKRPTTKKPTTKKPTTKKPTTKKPTTKTPSRCKAAGKIPNPSVPNCKGYIFCVASSNGNYIDYPYMCPLTSVFDPIFKYCSLTYKCPQVTTRRPTTIKPFTCTKIGRFPDTTVAGCKGYIMCSMTSTGSFITGKFLCGSTAVFNPNTSLCSSSAVYTCPK